MPNLSDKYGKTLLLDKLTSYCPGCGHGVVTRLVAEAIEKLGIRERTISIVGIGCGGFSHHYMDVDAIEATHGRSPSFAIGYKLARPDNIVFTYCGDGDSCAIGLGDLMHAANKGLPITSFMINNTVFGMTGGQMSPTTLEGQITSTTPKGRDVTWQGYPLLVPEMMREMPGVKFLSRETIVSPKTIMHAKKKHSEGLRVPDKRTGLRFRRTHRPLPDRPEEVRSRRLRMVQRQNVHNVQTPGFQRRSGAEVMLYKCMFSGSGGQGSALMAKMTCHGAIREGKKVVMTQTYGIEQRGGDSTAYVIISDEQIGSPIVENDANVVCALSQSTYELCYEGVAPGGLLFCNTSIVKEPKESDKFRQIFLPVSDMAVEIGSIRSANMVMLGAMIHVTGMLRRETIEQVLAEDLGKKKPALLDANIKALQAGWDAAPKE